MSDDLTKLMEQDFEETLASSVEKVDQQGLTSVAALARQIRDKEETISRLEETLKEEKKTLLKLTDEEMPAMLAEIGISSFSLDDGSTVEVKQTYGASILVDNRPAAYEWLREHGYDDVIKNTVLCQFGRGEDDLASSFAAFAQQQGYVPPAKDRNPSADATRLYQRTRGRRGSISYGAFRSMGWPTCSYQEE